MQSVCACVPNWPGKAPRAVKLAAQLLLLPLPTLQVQEGETVLTLSQGKPLRLVNVVNVLITNNRGQTLVEAQQILPNGNVRQRERPLSEKLLPGERWQEGVMRGVKEELGTVLPTEPEVGETDLPLALLP
jgi:hypothetical protein